MIFNKNFPTRLGVPRGLEQARTHRLLDSAGSGWTAGPAEPCADAPFLTPRHAFPLPWQVQPRPLINTEPQELQQHERAPRSAGPPSPSVERLRDNYLAGELTQTGVFLECALYPSSFLSLALHIQPCWTCPGSGMRIPRKREAETLLSAALAAQGLSNE